MIYSFAGYSGTQAATISLPTATLTEIQQEQEDVNIEGNKKDNTNTEVFDKKYGASLFVILFPCFFQVPELCLIFQCSLLFHFCVSWTVG